MPMPARANTEHLQPQAPRAVVFNCDGLLLDTAACWRMAYERVLRRERRQLTPPLLQSLNGASVRGAARALGVHPEVLHAELLGFLATGPVRPMPGAQALVARLHGHLPMAVASNTPRSLVSVGLRRAGLDTSLPVIVSAENGVREKPAPDVYIAACARLGVAPERAAAVEGSVVGARAALAADMCLVYVPSGEAGDVRADLVARRLDEPGLFRALGV